MNRRETKFGRLIKNDENWSDLEIIKSSDDIDPNEITYHIFGKGISGKITTWRRDFNSVKSSKGLHEVLKDKGLDIFLG